MSSRELPTNPVLIAELTVASSRLAEFRDVSNRLYPHLEDKGWALLGAYDTIVGVWGRCIRIWNVGSMDKLLSVPLQVAEIAEARSALDQMQQVVQQEVTSLATEWVATANLPQR